MNIRRVAALAVAGALAGLPPPGLAASPERNLTVIYSADERGEVMPCG
jgi:hypothetical protein